MALLTRKTFMERSPGSNTLPNTGLIGVETDQISSTNLSLSVPTHTDGDLLVAMICASGDPTGIPPTISTPAGWTQIGTVTLPATTSTPRLSVFRRTASIEPASYAFILNQTNSICGIMSAYDQNIFSTTQENIASNTGLTISPIAPSISPTANSLILRICGTDGLGLPTDITTFFPTGTVGRAAIEQSGIGNGCALGYSDHLEPSGATGTGTFTLFASDEWGTFSVSFNGGDGVTDTAALKDLADTSLDGEGFNGTTYEATELTFRKRV